MKLRELSFDDVVERLKVEPHPSRRNYLAMFSSWFGGIVTMPEFMMVPIDDHIVHRGDGVFEAIKCVGRKIYALDRHLERLESSAHLIGMELPHPMKEIRAIVLETGRRSKVDDFLVRMFVSRGPGSFTPNPYDTLGSQLYVMITALKHPPQERYQKGVSAATSAIAVKEGFFATVKSCNYLPNVLMKKEAVDRGVDFVISNDEAGAFAEGSTENFAILTEDGWLAIPAFERTLKGVTAVRAMELANEKLVDEGLVKGARNQRIQLEDVSRAREAFVFGTTIDCLPITTFNGRKIGEGVVGPVAKRLAEIFRADMASGPLIAPLD